MVAKHRRKAAAVATPALAAASRAAHADNSLPSIADAAVRRPVAVAFSVSRRQVYPQNLLQAKPSADLDFDDSTQVGVLAGSCVGLRPEIKRFDRVDTSRRIALA